MRSDAMLDTGELDKAAVWQRIVKALDELPRRELGPGERWH